MPRRLESLTQTELRLLPAEQTVFFFPIGPLEDFGPHLPLGLALEHAARLSWLMAERLERDQPGWVGVCMPAAPLSVSSVTTRAAITVRPHVARDWLVDSCLGLWRMGFRHFVCFTGHQGPRQLTAVEEAGRLLRNRTRLERFLALARLGPKPPTLVSAMSALVSRKDCMESPLWPDPAEHGGRRDTSLGLVLAPALVREEWRGLPPVAREGTRWSRLGERLRRTRSGYWGDPSQASVEEGERALQETIDELTPKLRAVWSGSDPERIFRSWYSVLPPNGSFFKAWILALAVGVLMVLWMVSVLAFQLGGP